MKLITFLLLFQSLLIISIKTQGQSIDTLASLKFEIYIDDEKKSLNDMKVEFIHKSSETDAFLGVNDLQNTDSEFEESILKPNENILVKINSDSIYLKKRSKGTFMIRITYQSNSHVVSQGYSYFKYGGRLVIGIITDTYQFRKKMYKKFKLANLYKEEKEELEDSFPYLTISENYSYKYAANGTLYVATKMNSQYGQRNAWWHTYTSPFIVK